jgi:radical SAM superfamily enzyme YgiQ (UPF0313 family)
VTDHDPLLELMRKVREEPGVKKVFIASGVRYDLAERSPEFVEGARAHHTGGQLSVAPEHSEERARQDEEAGHRELRALREMLLCASEEAGKEQYLVPYFISGHPGSTLEDMIELALYLKKKGMRPRQVQDFIPTPMSMATTCTTRASTRSRASRSTRRQAICARSACRRRSLLLGPGHHDEVREADAQQLGSAFERQFGEHPLRRSRAR